MQKETADAWFILCKKAKTNRDKDDPKRMELCIAKTSFLPIYLKTKLSMINISFEHVAIGVTEKEVGFDPNEFPEAEIVDKR